MPSVKDSKGSKKSAGGASQEHSGGSKADRNRRSSLKGSTGTSLFAHPLTGETVKERQQKVRENREARKRMITDEYRFIMGIVGGYVDLDMSAVEEFVLDSEEAVYLINSFLKPKGRRSLMFFYQEVDHEGRSHTEVRARTVKSGKVAVLLVTSGLEEKLTGTLVYCVKADANKELKMRNIADEACFGMINAGEAGSIIPALRTHLTKIYIPAIRAMSSWGELEKTPQGVKASAQFVESLDGFVHFIDGAHAALNEAITLHPCELIDVTALEGPADYQAIANNQDILTGLDELVHSWCKQIEQVLAESEQMRKEADDTGPMAELEHWKMRMAKFNSLVEQIKGAECRAVIKILLIAKSKTLKFWRELDSRITDAANEAKDNVKFLYTLEKECDPLYHADPVTVIDCIPKLINTIQMIHSISRYCNTSQRMTSLFIKVTNQMVTACKNYLTDRGVNRVWDQPRQPMIEKLKACLRLNQEYQKCFQRTKKRIAEDPTMRPFEFSEMYIFGKFDAFCKRLNQIIEVLNTLETYSVLSESKIEGIETISNRFQSIYSALKKKPYDPLDHRKPDFEADFTEFRRQISDFKNHFKMFMSGCFEKIVSISQSLELLGRFGKLGIPSLQAHIEDRYASLLHHFGKEVEAISKMYQRHCENPPLHRDVPPISGRISWARQLMRRIRNPMNIFEQHSSCLKTPEAYKIIRNFNQLATVLVEFEILYHKGWLKQVEIAKTGLQASLLVRHPDTGELYVNCDPQLIQLIRETEYMMKLNLPIPEMARLIFLRRDIIKTVDGNLKMMLEDVKKVRARIPNIFMPLMLPHMQRVEVAISPGVTMLNWNSLNIPAYISNVYSRLREVDLLVKQVNDIRDARIDAVLKEMSETVFCELPGDDPWTIDEFVTETQKRCAPLGKVLDHMSLCIEEAVHELASIFVESLERIGVSALGPSSLSAKSSERDRDRKLESRGENNKEGQRERTPKVPDEKTIDEEIDELILYFNHRNFEALLRATRNALDGLKRRLFCTNTTRSTYGKGTFSLSSDLPANTYNKAPFFKADISLVIPLVVVQPTLDDVQQALNKATQAVLDVTRSVAQWGQKRFKCTETSSAQDDGALGHIKRTVRANDSTEEIPASKLKNYYKSVAEHKDITKLLMVLTSVISSTKAEVMTCLDSFTQFYHVWDEDKEKTVADFVASDPILSEFKSEILKYQVIEQDVENIEPSFRVGHGAIELFSEPFKLALRVELKAWKLLFGHSINNKYKHSMDEITQFVSDYSKRLARQINDLEDVRNAMAALEDIRQNEIRIDMILGPIEEAYSMLNKFEVSVSREEVEGVDTLRYSFEKLLAQAGQVQSHLVKIQPQFKADLLEKVVVFREASSNYMSDYSEIGPMVSGITPQEASDRLNTFQVMVLMKCVKEQLREVLQAY